jgi:hypothetical protein
MILLQLTGNAHMAGPQDVAAKVEDALAAAARCSTDETTQNYDTLAQELQDLAELARLSCQSHDHYGALIGKLRAGDALSPEEMAKVRLLIVGDADYYIKYDEEFDRCKGDLAKILAEIERLKASELSVDALMHLSVLCREADSLLVVVQHYLDSRDRVRRFEETTKTALDRDSARTLATIIEGMVAQVR